MKRVFVVNPKAGRGISPRRLQRLETFFLRRGGSFDAVLTSSRQDVVTRTRELLRRGADQIVAVGGDGTLNAVANGFFEQGRLVRPDASLAAARTHGVRVRLFPGASGQWEVRLARGRPESGGPPGRCGGGASAR